METQLRVCVQDSLQLLLYDNARFLCERLVAQYSSEVNTHLLALCYFHSNQAYRCYHLLKGLSSKNCRYLFAQSALQLGKLNEGREALLKHGEHEVPNGAAGFYLLGRIYRLSSRFSEAKQAFTKALERDPLLWSAYEELCMLGGDHEAAKICQLASSGCSSAAGPLSPTDSIAATATAARINARQGVGFTNQINYLDGSAHASGYSACTPLDPPHLISKHNRGGGAYVAPIEPPSTAAFLIRRDKNKTAAAAHTTGPHFNNSSALPTKDASMSGGGGTEADAGGRGQRGGAVQMQLFGGPQWQTPSTPSAYTTPSAAPSASHSLSPSGLSFPDEFMSTESGASDDRPCQAGEDTVGPAAALSFLTPDLNGGGSLAPPAPPQKDPHGAAPKAFPGFKVPERSAPAVSGSVTDDSGSATPTTNSSGDPGTCATPTLGGSKRSIEGNNGVPMKPARNAHEPGRARKITGKLFSDTASVRRSSRLAALNTPYDDPQSPVGEVQPTHTSKQGAGFIHHESQNLPDPRCPPPSAAHFQNHFDLKIGDGGSGGAGERFHISQPSSNGGFVFGTGAGANEAGPAGDEAVSRILALLSPIYEAVRHLSNFRSAEAIKELRVMAKTSPFQYRTALVQCLLGRAHFENMDYDVAASSFEVARSADRFRVEGMDLYSTVLWHLKRDYDLSYLAQEMIALDRHAPQTWCVLGNFFSLQKEHESAVEFFQRALQLDGTHVYAYTLCGHEYLANEDFEKAATCYRNATRLDNRHYNAVYGMGQIYFRQEKYEMALVQFKSAANINARSSVLHTYVGITMHKQGMHERALVKLKEAIELDRRNPLARYELSNVLSSLERPDAALKELQQLNSIAPGEASVFIQMGKLYKRLGDLKKAQHHLEMALSFSTSSSDAGLIKASIEKLGVDEDEEDEEM